MITIDAQVMDDVKHGFQLPAKPDMLARLQQELSLPTPDLNRVANLVASDVAAAAVVLKVINSPYYGLARTVTDIRQAVMFLGLEAITHLVSGYLLQQAYDQNRCSIRLERFWDTANDIAQVCSIIGQHQKLKSRIPVENLHLLGLFHDAGIPAMAMHYPDYIKVLVAANRDYDRSLIDHEEERYGTNHATIGFYLANQWHLPKETCQLILRHHDFTVFSEQADEECVLQMAVLKMAENLVHQIRRFVAAPEWAHIKAKVLNVLNLDEEDYQDIKDDVDAAMGG